MAIPDIQSGENDAPFIFEFDSKDCPTDSVTVFSDRAEITRIVSLESKTGTQEVRINNLPKSIKPDSIHVAGGKGAATVLEVSYDVIYTEKPKDQDKERLKKEIEELEDQQLVLDQQKERLNHERSLLERYKEKVFFQPQVNPNDKEQPKGEAVADLLSEGNLNGISSYLRFCTDNTARLDDSLADNQKKSKELKDKIKDKRNVLSSLSSGVKEETETRRVTIAFFTSKETKVSFGLVYLVSGASWTPSYDARITSASGSGESKKEATLSLTYYGKIQQNSGEDWMNARLNLSTAAPASAAAAPEHPTRTLAYYVEPTRNYLSSSKSKSKSSMRFKKESRSERDEEKCHYEEEEQEYDEPAVEILVAKASKKNAISASFEIPRRGNIESDGKPHKMAITVLELKPRMEYFAVPRVNENVYLRALATNTTEFTLLPGPASIFLDNDFIATSELKANETTEYQFVLGVDSEIRLKYEAVKTLSSQSGMLKKTKDVKVEHKTVVSNTKQSAITLIISEVLPLSKEENIKVKLQEPEDIKKANNVKFDEHTGILTITSTIGAGSTTTIPFKFTVEYPAEKTITGLDEVDR